MSADDNKKSKTTKKLELCGILSMLILGIVLAVVLIVYLVQNKPNDSEFNKPGPAVEKTPYAALDSGVAWLRQQQHGDMWPKGQSADAVLALHLGKMDQFHTGNCEYRLAVKSAEFDLLSAMLQDRTLMDTFWGKGLLAKYIVALSGSCMNVKSFHGSDLIAILNNQFTMYQNYYNGDRRAMAWYALAHCVSMQPIGSNVETALTNNAGTYPMGVEEAAMVAIALTCMDYDNMTMYGTEIMAAHDYIIAAQANDGSFGDEFETALALQAILNSNNTKLEMIKDRGLTYLSTLIQDTKNGEYKNLAAASYIMTALAGKSFADAKPTSCPMMTVTTPATGQTFQITVRVNGGVVNNTVTRDFAATARAGDSLFTALENLQTTDAAFSFTSTLTSKGHVIESMLGLSLNANSLQYWKIMEGQTSVEKMGVSYIMPQANTVYTFEAATS